MSVFTRYLIIIPLLLLPAAVGCQKKVTPATPEPRVNVSAPAPSAITPPEAPVKAGTAEQPQTEAAKPPEIFVEAERNFAAGNHRQAAQAFEKFLYAFPKAPDRDRALLHLGFSLALSGDDRDLLQTEAALRRLIAEFPKSPYRLQAELILDLRARIERLQSDVRYRDERIRQLGDELRALKSIDLERRPSRPE